MLKQEYAYHDNNTKELNVPAFQLYVFFRWFIAGKCCCILLHVQCSST